MLKGPKDEGLALQKKCEEIAKHLSFGGKDNGDKKPWRTHELGNNNQTDFNCCSSYTSSRPELSLKLLDGLLGTDLVNLIPDRSNPSLLVTKKYHLGLSHNEDIYSKSRSCVSSISLPSCATSIDKLALFIYKHGFQDPLNEDTLLRYGNISTAVAASAKAAQRGKSQEKLLKSGVLRTLAKLLKQIHDGNFYNSPQDKIANAFLISIEKQRVGREGLSADWEFYAANHHPKIPLKEKTAYFQIIKELSKRVAKRTTLLATTSKLRLSIPSTHKTLQIRDKTPAVSSKLELASTWSNKSKGTANQCQLKIKGRACKRRVRVTKSKKCNLPLRILGFINTPTTQVASTGEIKQGPSSANLGLTCSTIGGVDGKIFEKKLDENVVRERPLTSRPEFMSLSAINLDKHDILGRGHKASKLINSRFKLKNIDLPSCIMTGVGNCTFSIPSGGLSTLARIEKLFPMVDKEEGLYNNKAQVEIERLKILRW